MTNLIQLTFENNNHVRITKGDNNEPWFVLRDVLRAMDTSTRPAIAKNDIEQGLGAGYTMNTQLDTGFGIKDTTIISEPAVTFLVSRSNTEASRRLNRWIHTEVLPVIRRAGEYKLTTNKPVDIAETAKAMLSMAQAFGFKANQAAIYADRATRKLINVSPLQLMEAELVSESKTVLLTPTEIGRQLNTSARSINKRLENLGLQQSFRGTKDELRWALTPKGAQFAEVLDTGKRHIDGTPVQQIKWQHEIVDLIEGA